MEGRSGRGYLPRPDKAVLFWFCRGRISHSKFLTNAEENVTKPGGLADPGKGRRSMTGT